MACNCYFPGDCDGSCAHDDMLAALKNVQKLIAEAAMTGFNWQDGDWPERLFESQQTTSRAIAKAEGRSTPTHP